VAGDVLEVPTPMISSATVPLASVGSARALRVSGLCLLLAVATLLVFGQAVRCGFISFDDDRYVDQNPALTAGLSAKGLAWAFTTNLTHWSETAEYWQPLTLLTRLADYQAYGFQPAGHHVTSVLIHLATGLALFGALRRLTGACWRSAIVAALFLVHPMHVEPVLWLSARKDLVNGLFYVLTLWAYGWYSARPGWRRYVLVFAAALAANMGKPMAVSLPFVLLLLDVWPLRRIDFSAAGWSRNAARLVTEKAPLFVLTFGIAVLAYLVQKDIGALAGSAGSDVLPLQWRLGNAALAVATYVAKAFVPVNLAIFYPHSGQNLNVPLAIAAAFGALFVSVFVLRQGRARPWLAVGWFWFLVVLAPVSGVIQIGEQAMADRYSYLSHVGLFIAVVWQCAEWARTRAVAGSHRDARSLGWLAAGVLTIFSVTSFFQVQTWRTSETVFSHALAVTQDNYVAHYSLGAVLWEQGRREEAMRHCTEAARIREPFLRHQLAAADDAVRRGAYAEAIPRLTRVLLLMPWNAELHHRLGTLLALDRQPGKALVQFDAALKYRPDWIHPRLSIAAVLIGEGQSEKAEKILRGVLAREPANSEAQGLIESALAQRGAR
jgi:tetratricopeptide (TPR) repeat protein